MGLFSRRASESELEERVEKLERAQRALEAEWVTWYEKAQKMLWRLVKRAEKNAGIGDDLPDSGNASQENVDRISAQILARRKNRGLLSG